MPAVPEEISSETSTILDVIRSLPARTLSATLRSPRGSNTRTFTGASLYDYSRAVGMLPGASTSAFGDYYFLVTASDGFSVSVTFFEVTPRVTRKQVLLAYEQDGEPLRVGVRLVVPGDDLGGRSILGVTKVELKSVASDGVQAGSARELAVRGVVRRPRAFSVGDLTGLAAAEIEIPEAKRHDGRIAPPQSYTGVLLWDLLTAAEIDDDPHVNEDAMSMIVVARGRDGYTAVIAPGEIDPRFMAGKVLVATSPLRDDEGAFRLIVPYDLSIARSIKNLGSLEIRRA